jgi:selenide,water dikinase
MKFGYAVTGVVDPANVVTNAGARPGDVLVLTKPIGTGAINTAVKKGVASKEVEAAAIKAMTTSAALASKEMVRLKANACTDITGFGLLGHAYEMANASEATLIIESEAVPLLPEVLELIAQGMLTRGDRNNRTYVGSNIAMASSVGEGMQSALFDPQTAGGLLISLDKTAALELVHNVEGSRVIGSVSARGASLIVVN